MAASLLNDLTFLESFALANDRSTVLKDVLGNNELSFVLRLLQAQHDNDAKTEASLLDEAKNTYFRHHSGLQEMKLRADLRRFAAASPADQKEILNQLRTRLGVYLNHSKEVSRDSVIEASEQYPSKLDDSVIATEKLLSDSLAEYQYGSPYTDLAEEWLATQKLPQAQLAKFVNSLRLPCLPNLVKLIAEDLNQDTRIQFGSRPIHNMLTQEQLEKLGSLKSDLKTNLNYITQVLLRQQPNKPLAELDVKEQAEFYKAQWKTATGLADVFNSIKCVIMFRCLEFDCKQGKHDFDKLATYLKMPWNSFPHKRASSQTDSRIVCNFGYSAPIGVFSRPSNADDKALIEDYLKAWYSNPSNVKTDKWDGLLEESYVKMVMAKTKIQSEHVDVVKNVATFTAMLEPHELADLKKEVKLEFSSLNPTEFDVKDEVKLGICLKNVPSLVVKVFRINARAYYRANLKELDASLNLAGLTPHEETHHDFSAASPFHLLQRTLSFASLSGRGVFVIEMLGNGKMCRALIRKGRLTFLEHPSALGHLFRLFDEQHQPVNGSLYVNGHSYDSDAKTGIIVVPYTAQQSERQAIILSAADGQFSSLGHFRHLSENYAFECGLYVDREALLQKSQAELVVRPLLTLNGQPVDVKLLRKVALKIESFNQDNVSTTQTIPDFELSNEREAVHRFNVPDNVRRMVFTLSAEVYVKSAARAQPVSATKEFVLNEIDDSDRLEDLHLRFTSQGYVLCALGKAGEACPHRTVELQLFHRYLNQPKTVHLQTDARGQIQLGPLPEIERLQARVTNAPSGNEYGGQFTLTPASTSVSRHVIHAREGDRIRIPYHGSAKSASPSQFCLLECGPEGSTWFRHDVTSRVSLSLSKSDASIVIKDLKAGEYKLVLREQSESSPQGNVVFIRVAEAGPVVMNDYVMQKHSFLQLRNHDQAQLQILSVSEQKDAIQIQLADWSAKTRVHFIASHFHPDYAIADELAKFAHPAPRAFTVPRLPSLYTKPRDLGDEHQYILDRKLAKKYVGNMLERPSLLLNAREKRATHFDAEPTLKSSQAFEQHSAELAREMGVPERAFAAKRMAYGGGARLGGRSVGVSRNLEFLNEPSTRLFNLRPDPATGLVTIARSQLGSAYHSEAMVVAVDGAAASVCRRVALSTEEKVAGEAKEPSASSSSSSSASLVLPLHPAYRDTRLMPGLDSAKHFTEQHLVSPLQAGQSLAIDDIQTATVEHYGSLKDVYGLYRTLALANGKSEDADLWHKFAFVLEWPTLAHEQKLKNYSEFACHELNFFLYFKDRAFFDSVVLPYLSNKLQKSFLDHWLLGCTEALATYTQFDRFARLNALEKILLGVKVADFGKVVFRLAADQHALLVKDPEEFIRLFKTALSSRALDSDEAASLVPRQKRETAQEREEVVARVSNQMQMQQALFSDEAPSMPSAAPMMAMAMAPAPMMARMARGGPDMAMADMAMPMASRSRGMPRMMAMRAQPAEEEDGEDLMGSSFDDAVDHLAQSGAVRQLYQAPPTTKEYEERDYYNVGSADEQAMANLVKINGFWADFAAFCARNAGGAESKEAFLSSNLCEAAGSFSEMMMALAVLGLPFTPSEHIVTGGRAGRLVFQADPKASTGVVLFHKEVKESEVVPSSVAVSQNYFDPLDAFDESGDERVDKYIAKEFLSRKMYGCRVVLTNVSSTHQKVEVLLQIPAGAMALSHRGSKAFSTRTDFVAVGPFSTQVIEYFFYFPSVGVYSHYPVHVSKTGKVVGHGSAMVLSVVDKSSTPPDLSSWKVVSQEGTSQQVLAFLQEHNVHKLDLERMAWRMSDKDFFVQALAVLRQRQAFHSTLWAYALQHNDTRALAEYLPTTNLVASVGPYFSSAVLSFDSAVMDASAGPQLLASNSGSAGSHGARLYRSPASSGSRYQHLEYAPLINARAHQLRNAQTSRGRVGVAANIQNSEFREQYTRFLQYIAFRAGSLSKLPARCLMEATYYLLLQDRIDEARAMFERIDASRLRDESRVQGVEMELALQYDYMAAYLDFFNPAGPSTALAIAQKYKQYPVLKKRRLFADIEAQIAEARSQGQAEAGSADDVKLGDEEAGRDREMQKLASSEPSLDLFVEANKIDIAYENVAKCTVNFYVMDIELLFSTNPFIKENDATFLFVAPNHALQLELPKGQASLTVDVPEQFRNANIYIEVLAGGLSRCKTYYSHAASVQVIENYGQVKVTQKNSSVPLARTYVKVYAKLQSGATEFYKDGYTDLRGRFDYASLSTDKLKAVQRFSILVLTESHGAVVREAAPPSQ